MADIDDAPNTDEISCFSYIVKADSECLALRTNTLQRFAQANQQVRPGAFEREYPDARRLRAHFAWAHEGKRAFLPGASSSF